MHTPVPTHKLAFKKKNSAVKACTRDWANRFSEEVEDKGGHKIQGERCNLIVNPCLVTGCYLFTVSWLYKMSLCIFKLH